MRDLAVATLVTIAEIEVPEQGVMKKALKDHVLVAGGASIVYAS